MGHKREVGYHALTEQLGKLQSSSNGKEGGEILSSVGGEREERGKNQRSLKIKMPAEEKPTL